MHLYLGRQDIGRTPCIYIYVPSARSIIIDAPNHSLHFSPHTAHKALHFVSSFDSRKLALYSRTAVTMARGFLAVLDVALALSQAASAKYWLDKRFNTDGTVRTG